MIFNKMSANVQETVCTKLFYTFSAFQQAIFQLQLPATSSKTNQTVQPGTARRFRTKEKKRDIDHCLAEISTKMGEC